MFFKKFFRTIVPALFLFVSSFASAQSVTWSQVINENKKVPFMRILGSDDNDNFYILRSNVSMQTDRDRSSFKNRLYVLQRFAADLHLMWEKELKGPLENSKISDVALINGHITVTYYIADKKTKEYIFYCSRVSEEGRWDGNVIELDRFRAEEFDEDNKPGIIASQDQQYMAFSYRKISADKNSQIFSVVLLDTALNIQYKRDLKLDVPIRLFVPVNLVVTNQGSVFIMGLHFMTEKKVKAPDQSFYDLFGYNRTRDAVVHYELKSEKQFLTDIGMSVDNVNKSIVVAGFYSDRTTYSTAGVFYYSLSEDSLTEKKMITTPFSQSYLQKFMGEHRDNKSGHELTNFSIDRVFIRRDGGAGLIAESYFEAMRSYYDYYMQMFIQHYYYHYGSIMLLSINPDGKILWNNLISKDQNSTDDGGYYSSYFGGTTGGKIFAIYNKYIDENSSVLYTTVDGTGVQKTDVLFTETEKVTVVPRSSRQVDDDTVLMPAYKQNRFYIIKISF